MPGSSVLSTGVCRPVFAIVRAWSQDIAQNPRATDDDPQAACIREGLKMHGGVIRPELVEVRGRMVLAGEYVEVPKHLLRRGARCGADVIAQYARERGFDVTTCDVLETLSGKRARAAVAAEGHTTADVAGCRRELAASGFSVTQNDVHALLSAMARGFLRIAAPPADPARVRALARARKRRQRELAREAGRCTMNPAHAAPPGRATCAPCADAATARKKRAA